MKMKKSILILASTALLIACGEAPEQPATDNKAANNTPTKSIVDTEARPTSAFTSFGETKVVGMSGAMLTNTMGMEIMGGDEIGFDGFYSLGKSSQGQGLHGPYELISPQPADKSGTWKQYKYTGSMFENEPDGENVAVITEYVDGKPLLNYTLTQTYTATGCKEATVTGTIHAGLNAVTETIENPADCTHSAIIESLITKWADKIKAGEKKAAKAK